MAGTTTKEEQDLTSGFPIETQTPNTSSTSNYIAELSTRVVQNQKDLDRFNEKLAAVETKLEKKLDSKVETAESHIEESKSKIIETLGLFVALFTFVSIEFRFLDKVESAPYIVSLTLLLAGILILFILLLDLIMRTWRKKWDRDKSKEKIYNSFTFLLFLSSLLLIILGLIFTPAVWNFITRSNNQITKQNNEKTNILPTNNSPQPTSTSNLSPT